MQATKTIADKDAMPTFLKWGMAFLAFYTVNQLHFPQSLGVPGLNVLNLICLVLWISHTRTGRRNDVKPVMRMRLFALFGALIYAFLLAQATLPGEFMIDVNYLKASIFYPIYFFMFFYVVRTEDDIRFIMYACLFVALIAGLEAFKEGLAYGNLTFNVAKRASGPFGEDASTANRAGIFFSMFFCLAMAVILYHPEPGNRWIRWTAMFAVFALLAGTFYTFSRQSYIIVVVIGALMMFRRGPVLIIVLAIAAGGYQFWVPEAAIDRLSDTQQVDEDGVEIVDDSTSSRWVQWEAAGRMIQDQPWGIGFNRFKDLSEGYGGKKDLDAHNHYVLFATEAGPLGLIIHLTLVFSLLWTAHRYFRLSKRRQNPLGRTLSSAFLFMTIAMLLGNIYGSPFSNGEVMGLYWALGGLMARHMYSLRKEDQPFRSASPTIPEGEVPPVGATDVPEMPRGRVRPRRRGRRQGNVPGVPVTANLRPE